MEWLWLALVPVAVVGGFFLVKGFMRVNAAIKELRAGIAQLGSAGESLKKVQGEMDQWRAAVDRNRQQ